VEDLEYSKKMSISSDMDGLRECLELFEDIHKRFQLDSDKSFAVQTVLLEAVTNAITHGNKLNKELETLVTIKINREEIFIEVEDQGEGFNLDLVPSPLDEGNLLLESGRGIFFMKQLSNSFKTNGKGNIVNIIIDR
jgi:serine/threonine-protein kinase RsbW